MSVEGVGGKTAAISFPIAPATPAQQHELPTPAAKPSRRRPSDRVRSAPITPAFVMTPAALAIQGGIAMLLQAGRIAAFAPGARKGAGAPREEADYEETPPPAHDDPERVSALRDRLAQLPPGELARLRELIDKARNTDGGYGFVVEPLELPAPPGPPPQASRLLSSAEVVGALARHGRVYLGPLVSIAKLAPAVGSYQVVDASSAEPIISYEALSSYLGVYR